MTGLHHWEGPNKDGLVWRDAHFCLALVSDPGSHIVSLRDHLQIHFPPKWHRRVSSGHIPAYQWWLRGTWERISTLVPRRWTCTKNPPFPSLDDPLPPGPCLFICQSVASPVYYCHPAPSWNPALRSQDLMSQAAILCFKKPHESRSLNTGCQLHQNKWQLEVFETRRGFEDEQRTAKS